MAASLGTASPEDPVRLGGVGSTLPRLTGLEAGIARAGEAGDCGAWWSQRSPLRAPRARAGTALIVTGHGWGHGVGMSQWGAYGYALHGWRCRRSSPTTTRARRWATSASSVRVPARARRVLRHRGLRDADGGDRRPAADPEAAGRDVRRRAATRLPVRMRAGLSFGHFAVFDCARAPLTFDGREYHGSSSLRSHGGGVSVVNALSLDTTCAASSRRSRRRTGPRGARGAGGRRPLVRPRAAEAELLYDLVPTRPTRSTAASGRTAALRSRRLRNARAGPDLGRPGGTTYYSSSSGGRTESAQDAWPARRRSRTSARWPDPYDSTRRTTTGARTTSPSPQLAARLGLGSAVESVQVERDDSLRAESVVFHLESGAEVSRSGAAVARTLHLLSDWFSIGELSALDE